MRSESLAAAAVVLLLASAASAQTPATAQAPASAPAVRVGPEYTPGWDMMTAQERDAFRQRMIAAPTKAECRRLRDEQLKSAARRANARGIKEPPNPRYDACPD